jgi:hypothetical protein
MSLITILDLGATLLALLTGLLLFKHLNTAFRIITLQTFVAFVVELTGATVFKNNNHGMYNFYMLADCSLLMIAGYFLLEKKKAGLFISGFLIFLSIWTYSIINHGITYFAQLAFITYSLLLVIIYFIALYHGALNYKKALYKFPALYVCSGIILFYACIVPYFSTFSLQAKLSPGQIRFLHLLALDILDEIRYLFLAIGFFLFYLNKEKTERS